MDTPENSASATPADSSAKGSVNCLPMGTRLDDFEITGVVGEGGFGIVYLAFDHSLQRTVAIKEYMPGALAGRATDNSVTIRSKRHEDTFKTGLRSFINEARLLARFDHPALVKVYRFWEQNSTGYMAMRYYEGQTLKSVVRNNPGFITEAWLKSMLKSILEALDALYKVQVLHRDISPDNIVIQQNGEAVLLDFGAARQIISDMSHALTVILKPGYAPVEQYADDATMSQGPWTDIYALSAVVYYAIVKKAPPTSVTRMIKDPMELLATGNYPGYSAEFLAAIDRGLSVRPEDRPQSIEEFRTLLGMAPPLSGHADPLPNPSTVRPAPTAGEPDETTVRITTIPILSKTKPPAPVEPATPIPPSAPIEQAASDSPGPASPSRKGSSALVPVITGVSLALLLVLGYGGYRFFTRERVLAVESVATASSAETASAAASPPPSSLNDASASASATAAPPVESPASASEGGGQATIPAPLPAAEAATEVKSIPPNPETDKPTGLVKLSIKPWGTILVDGDTKGVSPPLKRIRLSEGRHQIRVVNPNFSDYTVEIDVDKKKSSSIEFDFSSGAKALPSR